MAAGFGATICVLEQSRPKLSYFRAMAYDKFSEMPIELTSDMISIRITPLKGDIR